MAKVVMQAVVSVDGYIARPDDSVGPLFDWYGNGDTELSATASGWAFQVSRTSAGHVQPFWDAITVTVIGRHLFDTTNGWDGRPAAGDQLVIVTHRPLPEAWLADHPDARLRGQHPLHRQHRAERLVVCAAARAAGAAPLRLGDPGYRTALDRDGDAVACET